MRFSADDDSYRRRAEKSVRFRIPTGFFQDSVTCGGQGAKVCDGRAGDKGATAFGRKPKNIEQPAQCNFFEVGSRRSGTPKTRVLVPSCGQPVSRDCDGQRAADHKPEEPRPSHSHRSWRSDLIQEPQGFSRITLAIRQRFIKRAQLLDGFSCRSYRALGNSFKVTDRALGRVDKKFFVHRLGRTSLSPPENKKQILRE